MAADKLSKPARPKSSTARTESDKIAKEASDELAKSVRGIMKRSRGKSEPQD